MPAITVNATTDQNGYYQRSETVNPPGPFPLKIDLRAKLLSPADTTIIGAVDIDATDGNPKNQAKNFVASTGEQISLGTWRVDGGDNIAVVFGRTEPIRPNANLQIELEVELA